VKIQPASLINFRKHLERFITVNDEELNRIVSSFTYKTLRKNEHLIKEGEKVKHTYWIVKGLLISSFTDSKGKDHIIQFANENCWITDQNAFLQSEERNVQCRLHGRLRSLCLSYENREKLCAEMHSVERFFGKKPMIACQTTGPAAYLPYIRCKEKIRAFCSLSIPRLSSAYRRRPWPPTLACHVRP